MLPRVTARLVSVLIGFDVMHILKVPLHVLDIFEPPSVLCRTGQDCIKPIGNPLAVHSVFSLTNKISTCIATRTSRPAAPPLDLPFIVIVSTSTVSLLRSFLTFFEKLNLTREREKHIVLGGYKFAGGHNFACGTNRLTASTAFAEMNSV